MKKILGMKKLHIIDHHLKGKGLVPLGTKNNHEDKSDSDEQTGTITIVKTDLAKPRMYKVIMHNDDYTTTDFVVHVLVKFFSKSSSQAQVLMMKIHLEGQALCGIFTYEVAESKTVKVNKYSRDHGHPLTTSFEPCEG